jgi:hypothetical protein
MWHRIHQLLILQILVLATPAMSATLPAGARKIDNADFRLVFRPRTPQQISAFYEARGFPKPALELLRNLCFITVSFKNKSREIIWLDLNQWRFYTKNSVVLRIRRQEWPARWERLEIPRGLQATFHWTLLPESLDFRPQEAEGGNIILPRIDGPMTLIASFPTGRNQQGPPLKFTLQNLTCATDTE